MCDPALLLSSVQIFLTGFDTDHMWRTITSIIQQVCVCVCADVVLPVCVVYVDVVDLQVLFVCEPKLAQQTKKYIGMQ